MVCSTAWQRIWERQRRSARPFSTKAASGRFTRRSKPQLFRATRYGFTAIRFNAQLFPVKQKSFVELGSEINEVWF
jgi:hypothetical protein